MFKLPQLIGRSPSAKEFLTLDVGSDYVKCLVFRFIEGQGDRLKIVGKGKQPLDYYHTRAGAIADLEGVKQASLVAVSEALAEAGSSAREVVIGLSGEVTKGLVTTVRLTRPNRTAPVSESEMSKIIQKIEDAAFVEASKEIAEMTGNPDLDISLTNSSISSVKANDTYVRSPVGAACDRMEVGLFTAFAPSYHLDLLSRLASHLKLKILAITSGMYALSRALSKGAEENSNMVIMDVGGETTDVGVVFGGALVATRTLSIGGRHVSRAISDADGLSYSDAEEKKLRYSLGTLDSEENSRVQDVVKGVSEIWISGIELLFSDFEGVKTFPSKILLVGGGSSLKDFVAALYEEPWTKTIPFKEKPVLEKVSLASFEDISDSTNRCGGSDDIMPIALSQAYIEMSKL